MIRSSKPTDRGEFEIAIICALQLEADAVEALFDKCWDDDGEFYRKAPGDPNAYTTGVIGLHNVVLAHMPGMGKRCAASVASSFRSSFQGIKLALVVGICGGVPYGTEGEEILLGDVIISDGIIEYDFGRQLTNKFIRKDTFQDSLGRPNSEIRSLLTKLKGFRSRVRLRDNTSRYLKDLQQNPGFKKADYPGVYADRLFESTYHHKHHDFSTCALCENKDGEFCNIALSSSCLELKCKANKLVPRSRLLKATGASSKPNPVIHYGLMASGDTVMKSGEHRDKIAAMEKVIAFEMEGAGAWDSFPCVVIKGICDYADSHKNKEWQNYAAATAASCMKAFLQEWVSQEKPGQSMVPATSRDQEKIQQEKLERECLRSLCFPSIDDRQSNIASAHPDTCNWIFETAQFRQWHDRINLLNHNGVLWIKGKPGAGKSTLMKHTLLHCQGAFKDYVIAAYFFNARGNKLEKTPLGMLRSLLYQLLDQNHLIRKHFLPIFLSKERKHGKEWEWLGGELKNFLLSEMKKPQSNPILFLIDALDECNESEVREAVLYLEQLSISAVGSKTLFNICLSSRHYPNISMKKNLDLIIEVEYEHDRDISKYVQHNLRIRDKNIEEEILHKAAHVFMWVVLVTEILNQAFDYGEVRGMKKKLQEVPNDLDEVFWTLLSIDNPNKRRTILMLQWVLFARRLLSPEELYFAVLAGTEEQLGARNHSSDTQEAIRRFITSTSRGLIEVRRGHMDTVQFIHESVSDFLLRNKRLQKVDPTLEQNTIGVSHDRLVDCCMSYIMTKDLELPAENSSFSKHELAFNYPFLKYASTHILYHAEKAHEHHVTQQALIQQLQQPQGGFNRLRSYQDVFEDTDQLRFGSNASLLYAVYVYGYHALIQLVLLEKGNNINAQGGYYGNVLYAASYNGNSEDVQQLLSKGANPNARGRECTTALYIASIHKNKAIITLLIEAGADIDALGGEHGTALQAASYCGYSETVQHLLKKGANINILSGSYGTALHIASMYGHETIVRQLLEAGADVDKQGKKYGTALQAASYWGYDEIVRRLLRKGPDLNTKSMVYGNALYAASINGHRAIVRMLLEAGANVNLQGGEYGTALQAATRWGYSTIVQLLLKRGADVNLQSGTYSNALQVASVHGYEEIIELLLEAGANVNMRGGFYGTSLQAASTSGDTTVVYLLLVAGADVNAQGGKYGTALGAASAYGYPGVVRQLLEAGAVINTYSRGG